MRQGLKTFSNWPTYPQLYIKGELIGGLDIVKDMVASGDFAAALPQKASEDELNTKSVPPFQTHPPTPTHTQHPFRPIKKKKKESGGRCKRSCLKEFQDVSKGFPTL